MTALLEPTDEWFKVAMFKVLVMFNSCASLTQTNLAIFLTYVTEIGEQMAYDQFSVFPKVRRKEVRAGNLQFTEWSQ